MSEKEKSNKFSGGGGEKPFGKVWKKWWFWALIVAVLIGGVIEFTEPETEEPTTATAEPTTEPTATKEPETEKSEVTKEPETEKNSTEEIKDISAYELVTMEGHPVLYDYLSAAHTFWDNYAEKRIDFPDDHFDDFQAGKTVLIIDAWLSTERELEEHIMRGFEIYPNKEISLNEGLDIAKSYLPLDILRKWYALEWSKCYYSEENNTYQYYVLYAPTESGKESIDEQGLDYNYAGVSLTVQNDIVIGLEVVSTNPLGRNTDGKEIDWEYDFLN